MSEQGPHEGEDEAMRLLLRRALPDQPRDERGPGLLPSVQRRIRERSGGKFFSDGWSTSGSVTAWIAAAAVMLVVAIVVYFLLAPA
jgi:hypothetical protein